MVWVSKEVHDLAELVKPVVERMGYAYWGMEFSSHGRRAYLRVLIDHQDGITLDDCSEVSNQLSGVLDVENPIVQSYTLEVSSPGIERPLFEIAHYRRYIGENVKVSTYSMIGKRKNFSGALRAVEKDAVTVDVDGMEVQIPFNLIRRARLVYSDLQLKSCDMEQQQ